jgi:beta-galactosidase
VEIFNKYFFKDLAEFDIAWSLTEDGKVLQSGVLPTPPIGPRQKRIVTVPFAKPDFQPGAEYHLKLGFRLLKDYPWAPKGYELATGQIAIPNPQPAKPLLASAAAAPLKLTDAPPALTVSGQNFTATFDPKTGALSSLNYQGKSMLTEGIALNAFRCPVNNDGWAMGKWFEQGLRQLTHHCSGFTVERIGDALRLVARVVSQGEQGERCSAFGGNHTRLEPTRATTGENALQFHSQWVWTVYPDGTIACQVAIAPSGPVIALPKVGVKLELPETLSQATWFGRGPEENYPDRKTGSLLGQYSRTVRDLFVPYARPNDMANHEDVRWVALTDPQGNGLVFTSLGEPLSAAALPYSASELLLANHPPELPKSTRTVLTLDAAVLGLGGASCGPGPLERDIPRSNRAFHLGFLIRPVTPATTLADAARASVPVVAPVAAVRQKGKVTLTTATPGADIRYQVNQGPVQTVTEPIGVKAGDKLTAWAEKAGSQVSPTNTLDIAAGGADKSGYSVKYVSSQQQGEGEATHLIDGDPDTYWHTEYALTVTKHPHTVDIDLGQTKAFKAIAYLPRQDGPNGRVAQYRFAVSDAAANWTQVAEGRFPNTDKRQVVPLGQEVKARYLRFTALSELNGQDFASAAEIDIVP